MDYDLLKGWLDLHDKRRLLLSKYMAISVDQLYGKLNRKKLKESDLSLIEQVLPLIELRQSECIEDIEKIALCAVRMIGRKNKKIAVFALQESRRWSDLLANHYGLEVVE